MDESSIQDFMQEMDETRACAWPLCAGMAAPAGKPYVAGIDDREQVVYFRKYQCSEGHWYSEEWTW